MLLNNVIKLNGHVYMTLLKLGFIKRLFFSLILSVFVVLSVIVISWAIEPVNHLKTSDVDYDTYDFEDLDKASINHEVIPSDRLDAAIDAVVPSQPVLEFDPSTAVLLEDVKKVTNPTLDFITYLKDALQDDAGFAFITIAVGIFLLLSTINQYIKEASIGWKRLSLISSFVIGLGICLYIYFGDILRGDDFFLSLLSFPILLSVLLYAKVLYLWVRDGFEGDKI